MDEFSNRNLLTSSSLCWIFWYVLNETTLTPAAGCNFCNRIGAFSRLFNDTNALLLVAQRMNIDPNLWKYWTRSDCFQSSGNRTWKTWSRFGTATPFERAPPINETNAKSNRMYEINLFTILLILYYSRCLNTQSSASFSTLRNQFYRFCSINYSIKNTLSSARLTFVSRQIDIEYIRQTHHKYSAKMDSFVNFRGNFMIFERNVITCWENCAVEYSCNSIRRSWHSIQGPSQWNKCQSCMNRSRLHVP